MRPRFFPLLSAAFLAAFPSTEAAAQGWFGGSSAPPSDPPTIVRDNAKRTLSPNGLYRVEFVCKTFRGGLTEDQFSWFIQNNKAASLLLSVSDQNIGSTPTADNSKALLSVYNIGGPSTSRTRYINDACNGHPFFVAPRRPLYLIAAEANIDTRVLGPALKGLESVLKIVSSIWPLFAGAAIPAAVGTRISAVSDTAPSIQSFVSAFDSGLTGITPKELTEGHTRVTARFGTVDVYVTALRSIVGVPDNGQFKTDLEDAITKIVKPQISGTTEISAIETACRGVAGTLERLNNLSREDIAFSLVLISQTSGLTSPVQVIRCLKDYAFLAVQNKFTDRLPKSLRFGEADVRNVIDDGPISIQPDFQTAKPALTSLMGQLKRYVAAETAPPFEGALGKAMLTPILFEDEAELLSDGVNTDGSGRIVTADVLAALKAKGYRRFGCLYPDNGAVAFFLALPDRGSLPKGYKIADALLMRVWLTERKVAKLRVSVEGDQIAAVVKGNSGLCGLDATFAD